MCKYCAFEENGDLTDDHQDLIDSVFKTVNSEDKECARLEIKSNIELSKKGIILLSGLQTDDSGGEYVLSGRIKINYCPMCGRKLTE